MATKVELAKESVMVSDTDSDEGMEQPVIIEDYEGGQGISIMASDGDYVYMPYRMVKEVCKAMLNYAKKMK